MMPQSEEEASDVLLFEEKPDTIVPADYRIESLVIPKVESVLDDALAILHRQLKSVGKSMVEVDAPLTEKEVRSLASVVDAISKISREQRQRAELEDEEMMLLSDEELEAELENL